VYSVGLILRHFPVEAAAEGINPANVTTDRSSAVTKTLFRFMHSLSFSGKVVPGESDYDGVCSKRVL